VVFRVEITAPSTQTEFLFIRKLSNIVLYSSGISFRRHVRQCQMTSETGADFLCPHLVSRAFQAKEILRRHCCVVRAQQLLSSWDASSSAQFLIVSRSGGARVTASWEKRPWCSPGDLVVLRVTIVRVHVIVA